MNARKAFPRGARGLSQEPRQTLRRAGTAEWVEHGVPIRFIDADHRHRAAQASVDTTRCGYERAARAGLAQLSELTNLPMVTPANRGL